MLHTQLAPGNCARRTLVSGVLSTQIYDLAEPHIQEYTVTALTGQIRRELLPLDRNRRGN